MQTCLACRQHLEGLKQHAKALINSQQQLLQQNNVLTLQLKELSAPSQEQKLWKEKYQRMVQINAMLGENTKKLRMVRGQKQNTPRKRNDQKRDRLSKSVGIQRSESVNKMDNFMIKVLQSQNTNCIKANHKDNKRVVLKL